MPIRSYADRGTHDISTGVNSKAARNSLPVELHILAQRRLAYLNAIVSLDDLRVRPVLNLHGLQRQRKGQHAIRINDQYRVCFKWDAGYADQIQIIDYH
jgi:proteic killer suppression protein